MLLHVLFLRGCVASSLPLELCVFWWYQTPSSLSVAVVSGWRGGFEVGSLTLMLLHKVLHGEALALKGYVSFHRGGLPADVVLCQETGRGSLDPPHPPGEKSDFRHCGHGRLLEFLSGFGFFFF